MRVITRLVDITLLVAYMVLLFAFRLQIIWFSLALYLLSIKLFVRSFALKQDSSLFLGALLFYLSVLGALRVLWSISFFDIYIAYVFAIGFASLCVYLFFRQNIHLKVVAIFFLEVILLSVIKLSLLTQSEFIVLQSLYAIFVLANLLSRGYYNSRST